MDSHDKPAAKSPSHTSPASPIDLAQLQPDWSEHADSPMRKRPRLDSGSAEDGAMSSDRPPSSRTLTNRPSSVSPATPAAANDTPSPPLRSSLDKTPSKVTLNLRSTKLDASPATSYDGAEPMTEPSSASRPGSERADHVDTRQPSAPPNSVDFTADSPLSSSQSPPVIEIEVDDSEDINEDPYSAVEMLVGTSSTEAQLLEEFPFAVEHGVIDAANLLAEAMARDVIEPDWIIGISVWLEEWLRHAQTSRIHCHRSYLNKQVFWNTLAQIYWKFLNRKFVNMGERTGIDELLLIPDRVHFGMFPVRSEDMPRPRVISNFFGTYLELIGHFIAIDLKTLRRTPLDPGTSPELLSTRHLKNLELIFRSHEEPGLWRLLRHQYQLNVEQMQQNLAVTTLRHQSQVLTDLGEITKIMTQNIQIWPNHGICLGVCGRAMRNLASCLLSFVTDLSVEELPASYQSFCEYSLDVVELLKRLLLEDVEKQAASLPIDLSGAMAKLAYELLFVIAGLDPAKAMSRFKDVLDDSEDIAAQDFQRVLSDNLFIRLMWKFVTKGRMELRVQGVISMSTTLIQLWKDYNSIRSSEHLHPVLRSTSKWLMKERVLEYIISVDSHPQIITRSRDILGFLVVTRCWTRQMTDFFCATIVSIQDRRIVAAALEIVAGILNLAQEAQLLDFCERLTELPFDAFGLEMRNFVRRLMDEFPSSGPATPSQNRVHPNDLCLHLLQQAARERVLQHQNADVEDLHHLASEMLKRLAQRAPDPEERHRLYLACLEEIEARSKKSLGSVDAIFTLVNTHRSDDLRLVTMDLDLVRILAEELSTLDDVKRSDSVGEARPLNGLLPYLRLFTFLISHTPTSLSEHLERELWSHLIGEKALNDGARDLAWHCLREIVCKMGTRTNPLIDRLIEEHLPLLSSGLFNPGVFKFVEASIQYLQRVSPPPSPAENQVMKMPLANLLWRLILESSGEGNLQDYAIALLSQQHLDTVFISRAPMSSVSATHTALIDQCIRQLNDAASQISIDGDNSMHEAPNGAGLKLSVHQAELQFARTLQFMQKFVADVKARPAFSDAVIRSKSPSPELPSPDLDGTSLFFKYQAFSLGKEEKIKELKLSGSATLMDLHEELRRVTGFASISVINCGKALDLTSVRDLPAKSLSDKGLLIVRNIGEITSMPVQVASSSSAAERALFAYFDVLYEFLDLMERLSAHVYHFLNGFPPHSRVRDVVLHDNVSLVELFPPERRIRTLYSIRSLKGCLILQLNTGNVEEKLIAHGVRMLTTALTDSEFHSAYLSSVVDQEVAINLVDCLHTFLKERPLHSPLGAYFTDERALVDQLCGLLRKAKSHLSSLLNHESWLIYSTILEASFHNRQIWQIFIKLEDVAEIHHWLLTGIITQSSKDRVKNCIEGACRSILSPIAVQPTEYAAFYWDTLSAMIPRLAEHPTQSRQALATAAAIFSNYAAGQSDEITLQSFIASWTTLLSQHTHAEIPGQNQVDDFVLGLTRLLSVCVSFLKSFKKPVSDRGLVGIIFTKFLFPPLSNEMLESPSTNGFVPILDEETRKELYNLATALTEDPSSYELLINIVLDLLGREASCEPTLWNSDRNKWLRTSTGYAGLKNLTNTCYMNSLMTQLFMNINFRNFMLDAKLVASNSPQELLAATQTLFAEMQCGIQKYADTSRFAHAVQPYDSDHIDVTVQMDVDEFYNLLFDRWESQIITSSAKQKFRSFYGGQLVTQVKSMDCEHVSERLEPFLAIQCDVQGKTSLSESLKSYVEGDAMEGDNKYKCESCGGRLVNAIKRSCLKDIPENLIFHLKRFDFDLATLMRNKINDEFRFPETIDMTPYHVDYLSDPKAEHAADLFELVGVLVHNGTAETGHYYSYIQLSTMVNGKPSWAEFNDVEVTEFDPSKIPDQCFGGFLEQNGSEAQFSKTHNAYMLFYRRLSTLEANITASIDPNITVNAARESEGHDGAQIIQETADKILSSNELLLRRYCLFGATHAHFTRSLVSMLKHRRGGVCSDDHLLERKVISMALQHLVVVLAKVKEVPDLDPLTLAIKRITSACGECASLALKWIVSRAEVTSDMLLQSPIAKVRVVWADLVAGTLQDLRRNDPQLYGLDVSETNMEHLEWARKTGQFQAVIQLLSDLFYNTGKHFRAWDEYFGLWTSIAETGMPELGVLLCEDIFRDCLELLLFDRKTMGILQSDRNNENIHIMSRMKRTPPKLGLLRLVYTFLVHLDLFGRLVTSNRQRLQNYDAELKRFPITEAEQRAVLHYDKHARYMPFTIRCMEVMEDMGDVNGTWYPGEIVSYMLDAGASQVMVARIAHSIAFGLREWLPEYAGFLLRTAMHFCKSCQHPSDAMQIMKAAALNAETMATQAEPKRNAMGFALDYASQNGQNHLSFLEELALLTTSGYSTADREELSFLSYVITYAGTWGPALLLYDERAVRENALSILDALIFDHYPKEFDNSESGAMDETRADACRGIFRGCLNHLSRTEHHRMPRLVVKPTLTAMERSVMWLTKLRQFGHGSLLRLDEDENIIARFHDLKRRGLELWREEDGEGAFSETEWASQFDDDDSDEMTED